MSDNKNLERELESFLAEENSRVAALYRKLPRHEPDPALDASVLAMARQAVAPRQTRNCWLPALSAAAAVLVVAGIAYRAGPQVWNDRGTQSASSVTRAVDETKATAVSPASPPSAAASPAQEAPSEVTADLGVYTAEPVSTPAPSARADALARRKTAETSRQQSSVLAPQAFPQPQAAATEIQEKRLDKSTETAPPPSPARDAALQSLDAAVFPPNEPQKAEAASTSDHEQKDVAPGGAASMSGAMKGAAAQPSAPVAPARSEFAPAPAAAAMKPVPDNRLYPEHWISNIEKMLRENRREEAIRSLAQFRRQYPDYRLPDDLQDLK